MVNKEKTLEGIIIDQLHYPTKTKSEMTIMTDDKIEYSFEIFPRHSYADNVWALSKNKRIRIEAIIDDNTNEIIKINELWSKIELREYFNP